MPKRTPREQIERAFHVSFKLPEQATALLDAYRDQVREELAAAEKRAEQWEQARDAEVLATTRVFDEYYRRWQSTVVEARRQARRADELEQRAVDSAWNTMRLGEEITRLRAALREARDTLTASAPPPRCSTWPPSSPPAGRPRTAGPNPRNTVLINLTPHPIRIYRPERADGSDDIDDGLLCVIPPEKQPARIATVELGTEYTDLVPTSMVEYGHTHNLPPKREGVYPIVSLPVALSRVPYGRNDLRVPYLEVRNSTGTVIGCRMLAQPV
ncbi:hypothetical protein ACFV1L_18500 [Kitasatospora sp. NPDC059646]|uniref:hypothetical protein n=1 Tax=Kitasatospora sp. NPDC059646 TaxID=3346893 RepID=UPI003682D706